MGDGTHSLRQRKKKLLGRVVGYGPILHLNEISAIRRTPNLIVTARTCNRIRNAKANERDKCLPTAQIVYVESLSVVEVLFGTHI